MYLFTIKEDMKIHSGKKKILKDDFVKMMSAQDILDEANKQARYIIDTAEKDAIGIKKKAEEEGYSNGLKPFNKHIIHFDDKIKLLRSELQISILPLVFKTTKRIIGSALTKHPELVVDIVSNAIKNVTSNQEIKIFVHKDDLHYIEEKKEELKNLFEHVDAFDIEVRKDVERGSCIIQTEKGILNATLENQFSALEKALQSSD
jgi:type III secretion protein L